MTTTKKTDEFTIDLKPIAEIQKGIINAKKLISKLKVETPEQCVEASKVLANVAKLRRAAVARYKTVKAPLLDASRAVDANRNAALDAIAALEADVSRMIKAFRETEAKARAAVEEQMRKQQEESAEQRRQEQLASIAAAAAATPDPNVRKLLEKQQEVVASAHTIIEPITPLEQPKTLADGVHERGLAHAAIDNFEKLVLQVAAQIMSGKAFDDWGLTAAGSAGPIVLDFLRRFNPNAQATLACLQPAMPHLNKLAKNIGAADLALEGVSVVEDSSFVAR